MPDFVTSFLLVQAAGILRHFGIVEQWSTVHPVASDQLRSKHL
jgi:hypothetical protein